MIKFNLYNVTNGTHKAKISYSVGGLVGDHTTITLYAQEYGNDLHKIFENVINDTDSMIDYFEKGKVRIPTTSVYYCDALAAIRRLRIKRGY